MAKTKKQYVLERDLVIPAGTVLGPAPVKVERGDDHVEHVIALGANACAYLTVHIGDGIETGLVREVQP